MQGVVTQGRVNPDTHLLWYQLAAAAVVLVVAKQECCSVGSGECRHAVEPGRDRLPTSGHRIERRISPFRDDFVLKSLRQPQVALVHEGAVSTRRDRIASSHPGGKGIEWSRKGKTPDKTAARVMKLLRSNRVIRSSPGATDHRFDPQGAIIRAGKVFALFALRQFQCRARDSRASAVTTYVHRVGDTPVGVRDGGACRPQSR
jgi:hypothetical protein